MQRIKKVKWPTRNIGGDRAFCKLRYVVGGDFPIPSGQAARTVPLKYNVGAWSAALPDQHHIFGVLGHTPNLSTMAALYLKYRIRGIKLKLTYWQQSGTPVVLFTNAVSDQDDLLDGPEPDFPVPTISVMPEQRWARYRVCSQTNNGGKPTVLKSYYSVNKVYGPDRVVKNDTAFIGEMQLNSPYWATTGTGSSPAVPVYGPWLQYGIFTMNGSDTTAGTAVTGVMKVEATVYTEFFGKRTSVQ